jgi:TolC family type I secretion outer membrane protein
MDRTISMISIILALALLQPLTAVSQEPPSEKAQPPAAADTKKVEEKTPGANAQVGRTPSAVDNSGAAGLTDVIKKGDLLTLKRCIEIALNKQPSMLASLFTVGAYESRIGQAQSGYYPQVSLTGEYNRVKSLSYSSSDSNTSSTTGNRSYDQYNGTAGLTQMIYDFGKTPTQVNIAKLNLDASRSDLETTRATTVQNVKQSYYGLLKAQRNLEVARETITQYEQHLQQAKGFYEVGTKPKYDVTKAEVDLSNARLNLITVDNALKIARVTLNNSIGLPDAADFNIEDTLGRTRKDVTLKHAVVSALQNRPEVVATGRRVRAAEENINLAQKGYLPVISGNASYSRGSMDEMSFKRDGWNAGISVTIPIFSGFLTHYQVKDAEATYNAAKANFDLLKQNVILEVQQAYLNLVAAADKIPTSELAQRQASENLEIANGRYAAGVGNPIEVTDAQVAYTNAKTTYIQALYDYNIAVANLERSMGLK